MRGHRRKRVDIDIDELKCKFRYEPSTGNLYSRRTGKRVGGRQGGYLTAWVSESKRIFVHRIAWAIIHGEWPHEIDHINGIRTDNRLENLRPADRVLQMQNVPIFSNNTTGVIGVCPCKQTGKYKATINTEDGQIWLGRHETIEAAAKARRDAEQLLGWRSRL